MAPRAVDSSASTPGGDSILFKVKLFTMIFLIVLDISFNSSVENDTFGVTSTEDGEGNTILVLILACQLMVQVGIFASLFLMMFETYPFRVGLMGMLTSQYLAVYAINVVYLVMTACVYGYRVASMIGNAEMGIWEVWDLRGYLPLSVVHKIAATMYYVTNVRAALTLSDPMFYSKIAWVGRYFDSGGGFGGAGGEVVDCTRGGPREPNRGFEK